MRRSHVLLNAALIPCTIALLVMLVLSLLHRPAADGDWRRSPAGPVLAPAHPASEQTRHFFDWASHLRWRPLTNSANPFFSLAIQPPPPPPPPAPSPTTRKIDVTYRGFFETSAGIRRAVIQVADKQILARRGDKVVADYATAAIELKHLALTNAAGTAVRLEFAKPQSLEIPVK